MVALKCDVPLTRLGEMGHSAEFARRHSFCEIFTPEDIFKVLHAIDFVHALLRRQQQADLIPLARRLRCI